MPKLNGSGTISLAGSTSGQSVALMELRSGTGQISLNDSDVRNEAGISSGQISMSNLYGKFKAFNCIAYGIGGGGTGNGDTSGGGGGGGAVVKQFTMFSGGLTTSTVVPGGSGGLQATGGTSYMTNSLWTIYAYGGAGNRGPYCGGCGGPAAGGGGASGGDLNLSGGTGSGWNNIYGVDNGPAYDQYGNYVGENYSYYQADGGDGQSASLNGITYYAGGGGGGGSDYGNSSGFYGSYGGNGGSYAGHGGYGPHGGYGQAGFNYGGGGGGAGNYHGGNGYGGPGVFVITYNSPTQLASGGSVSFDGTTWTHIFTSADNFTAI